MHDASTQHDAGTRVKTISTNDDATWLFFN
jgi:hypothetical protein